MVKLFELLLIFTSKSLIDYFITIELFGDFLARLMKSVNFSLTKPQFPPLKHFALEFVDYNGLKSIFLFIFKTKFNYFFFLFRL